MTSSIAISQVRGNLPGVTPFVFHHATTVAIGRVERLFENTRTGIHGASISCVGVIDVYVEKRGRRPTNSGVANHDERVADPDLGWTGLTIFSRCAEHLVEELDELFCIVSHNSWRNSGPTFRGKVRPVAC